MPPHFRNGLPLFKSGVPLFSATSENCGCCCSLSTCTGCTNYATAEFELELDGYATAVLTRWTGCIWRYTYGGSTCGKISYIEFQPSISTSGCTTGTNAYQSNWNLRGNILGTGSGYSYAVAGVCIKDCAQFDTLDQAVTMNYCLFGTWSCSLAAMYPIYGRIRRV